MHFRMGEKNKEKLRIRSNVAKRNEQNENLPL